MATALGVRMIGTFSQFQRHFFLAYWCCKNFEISISRRSPLQSTSSDLVADGQPTTKSNDHTLDFQFRKLIEITNSI